MCGVVAWVMARIAACMYMHVCMYVCAYAETLGGDQGRIVHRFALNPVAMSTLQKIGGERWQGAV